MAEREYEPYFSRRIAGILTTVCGGVSIFLVSLLIDAPSKVDKESQTRHYAQQETIGELSRELDELRATISKLETDKERLRITVEEGTGDRFTGNDWNREQKRLDERAERNRSEIEDLRRVDEKLFDTVMGTCRNARSD